ncbi:hypothetical protein EFW17_22760 [Halostreptopolyspora alba]|uniref:Uncharacterized protein n=1 Tax=Halostreptopolyspora alba TaxID=2487137 RepID=A0A3N0DYF2_9ACTN|nr:hypothetical protein EFW17_22760 [Nocardiopsaceae bacterium YIM 96095]
MSAWGAGPPVLGHVVGEWAFLRLAPVHPSRVASVTVSGSSAASAGPGFCEGWDMVGTVTDPAGV